MTGQTGLSVVIVAHNSRPYLSACLRSIYDQTDAPPLEVIVVDNGSRPGEIEVIRQDFPQLTLVTSSRNLGFAAGANLGIRQAKGTHLLLLNPDTTVAPGALTRMAEFIKATPDAGAVGPKLLNPDGSLQLSCRTFPGRWMVFAHRYALLTRLFPQNPATRRYLLTDWDHASVRPVDWVSGACLMTSRKVLERVGLLDEKFFLFNEDVDFCRRVWAAGWKVYYVPDAVVFHHVGISGRHDDVSLILARHRSMLHYHHKHFRPYGPLGLLTDAAIIARALLHVCLVPLRSGLRRG